MMQDGSTEVFGPDIVTDFLDKNDFDLVVRAHQASSFLLSFRRHLILVVAEKVENGDAITKASGFVFAADQRDN